MNEIQQCGKYSYRLGFEMLGPVFAAFAQILLHEASRKSISHLAFISRDGDFLGDVTKKLLELKQPSSPPSIDYVYLSRISTSLPQQERFGENAIVDATFVQAGRPSIGSLLAFYGMKERDFSEDLKRHGLLMDSDDSSAIRFLLQDPKFLARVESERLRQKSLLVDYLRQIKVLGNPACALVDIGWRGSIVAALASTFSREPDYQPLNAYYLGYWHEQGCHAAQGCHITGILSDISRPQNIREAASYYVGHVLEAICRAEHGTVVAYRRDADGLVQPVLAGESEQRQAEHASEQMRLPIRHGILDYIEANAASLALAVVDPERLRNEMQRRLLRLAFYPTREEIAAAGRLRHTEGHAQGWSRPLIDDFRPSPLRNPRQWLAGLSSPWRSGYVMATGGRMLASFFISIETLLIALPTSFRSRLRNLALTMSQRA